MSLDIIRHLENSAESGHIQWRYDENECTLYIRGHGRMTDFTCDEDGPITPWIEHNVNSIVIEEGITHIGDHSFEELYELTSVCLPESLISIGKAAFSSCESIEEIELPSNLVTIANGAFAGTDSLERLDIPEGVESIGDSAFTCSAIEEITLPSTLKTLGSDVFNCAKIKSIEIPEKVRYIGDYTFCDCENLTEVLIDGTITSIGKEAFFRCAQLKKINLPDGLIEIGPEAFEGCENLTSLKIPSTVRKICKDAFKDCSRLVLEIPESVSLEDGAVDGVSRVKKTITSGWIDLPSKAPARKENPLIESGASKYSLGYITNLSPDTEIYFCMVPLGSPTPFESEELKFPLSDTRSTFYFECHGTNHNMATKLVEDRSEYLFLGKFEINFGKLLPEGTNISLQYVLTNDGLFCRCRFEGKVHDFPLKKA